MLLSTCQLELGFINYMNGTFSFQIWIYKLLNAILKSLEVYNFAITVSRKLICSYVRWLQMNKHIVRYTCHMYIYTYITHVTCRMSHIHIYVTYTHSMSYDCKWINILLDPTGVLYNFFSFKNNIFARGGFCTFPQLNMTTIL